MKSINARVLILGHQGDDVIETLLMRIARGSSSAGLSAPHPVKTFPDGFIRLRPMLACGRRELAEGLRKTKVRWREDPSNASNRYLRNRLRRYVVPEWKRVSEHDVRKGVLLTREILEADDQALERWADTVIPAGKRVGELDLCAVKPLPRAVLRRVLHRFLNRNLGVAGLSREAFEGLIDRIFAGSKGKHSIGPDTFLEIDGDRLSIRRAGDRGPCWNDVIVTVGSEVAFPGGSILRIEGIASLRTGTGTDPSPFSASLVSVLS